MYVVDDRIMQNGFLGAGHISRVDQSRVVGIQLGEIQIV